MSTASRSCRTAGGGTGLRRISTPIRCRSSGSVSSRTPSISRSTVACPANVSESVDVAACAPMRQLYPRRHGRRRVQVAKRRHRRRLAQAGGRRGPRRAGGRRAGARCAGQSSRGARGWPPWPPAGSDRADSVVSASKTRPRRSSPRTSCITSGSARSRALTPSAPPQSAWPRSAACPSPSRGAPPGLQRRATRSSRKRRRARPACRRCRPSPPTSRRP